MHLSEYIQMHTNKRFRWGSHDCITFSIGWLELKTGRDYLTEHRPWRTAREAKQKLRDRQGLFFLFDENLIRINPNMAQDGNITIINGAACLFSGRHVVSVGKTGLIFADRLRADVAWVI